MLETVQYNAELEAPGIKMDKRRKPHDKARKKKRSSTIEQDLIAKDHAISPCPLARLSPSSFADLSMPKGEITWLSSMCHHLHHVCLSQGIKSYMKPRIWHKSVSLRIEWLQVETPVLRSQTLIAMNSVVFNDQMQWSPSNLPRCRQVIWIRPPNPATTNSQQRCDQN